jgi:hypothetical protein
MAQRDNYASHEDPFLSGSALENQPSTALANFEKKLICLLLGRAVDQALTELGKFAADLRLDVISQERAANCLRERRSKHNRDAVISRRNRFCEWRDRSNSPARC